MKFLYRQEFHCQLVSTLTVASVAANAATDIDHDDHDMRWHRKFLEKSEF